MKKVHINVKDWEKRKRTTRNLQNLLLHTEKYLLWKTLELLGNRDLHVMSRECFMEPNGFNHISRTFLRFVGVYVEDARSFLGRRVIIRRRTVFEEERD